MPNGGSDCCGTCCFNSVKDRDAMFDPAIQPSCEIRGLGIEEPFWTYCANHPGHNPDEIQVPIGPVYVDSGEGFPYTRKLYRQSPDTPEIRLELLKLLAQIIEEPRTEYLSPTKLDGEVIKQLMAFGEVRALDDLRRIARFDPLLVHEDRPSGRSQLGVVALAIEALGAIACDDELDLLEQQVGSGLGEVDLTDEAIHAFAVVRYHAVRALRHSSSERAIAALRRASVDPNSDVASFAIDILAGGGPPDER